MTITTKIKIAIFATFVSAVILAVSLLFVVGVMDVAANIRLLVIIETLVIGAIITGAVIYLFVTVFADYDDLRELTAQLADPAHASVPQTLLDQDNEAGKIAQIFQNLITYYQEQYKTLETKVRRRTKALEESKAKDEAIIKNLAEGLVVTDLDRKVIFANAAAENMLGYRLFELFERIWPDFLLTKDKRQEEVPLDRLPIVRALATKQPVRADISAHYYYMRKDGSLFPVLISAAPVIVGGEMIGGVVVFRDVTKEVEVDKAKTEFVSLASHQLRTPLSTINWYTETILAGDAGDLSPDQKPFFEQIYESTQRMINLVNALLNVSRLELGTFMVEPEEADIVELSEKLLVELQPKVTEKKLTLEKRFGAIPKIMLDTQLTWIVLQNLLTNAIKYTPDEGKIIFTLVAQKMGEVVGGTTLAQDSIVITVTDTGYGIPSYQQDQIFSKLFRADNVREKETEGTGLGLYIVKSIVEHVEGQLWFTSELEKGSSFYVALPLAGMKERKGTKALSPAE